MLQRATADGAESADVGLSAGAWCLGDAGLSSLANRRQVASLFDRIEKERNAAARELAPPRERRGGLYTRVCRVCEYWIIYVQMIYSGAMQVPVAHEVGIILKKCVRCVLPAVNGLDVVARKAKKAVIKAHLTLAVGLAPDQFVARPARRRACHRGQCLADTSRRCRRSR